MVAIFVTATGTDIGKTYAICSLIGALRRAGANVFALKPVISGFDEARAQESDSGRILAALDRSCDRASLDAISPWRYAAALSAEMAAEREGRTVPFDDIVAFCSRAAATTTGLCLIEGVGGLMSPIDDRRTNRDLIVAARATPLLVAGSYLGTISHILTALAALDLVKVTPIAVVISESESSPIGLAELAARLAGFTQVPIVAIARNREAPAALIDLVAARA